MGLTGAILGDIAGSKWEFVLHRTKEFTISNLFEKDCCFTDDTVMSIATMDAVENNIPFDVAYRKWGKKYPDAGYGPAFYQWLNNDDCGPYNSLGDGSAMRVSYIGEKYRLRKTVEKKAKQSAMVTHNHPEGIKGAVTIAVCVWMAENLHRETPYMPCIDPSEKKMRKVKEKILQYGIKQYPSIKYKYGCDIPVKEYKNKMSSDVTCMGTVPVAIRCFYETDSFGECMKLICSMVCDTDTIGAMAGAICDSFYKGCFREYSQNLEILMFNRYLTDELFNQVINHPLLRYDSLFLLSALESIDGVTDESGFNKKYFDEYYEGVDTYIEAVNEDDYEKLKRRFKEVW